MFTFTGSAQRSLTVVAFGGFLAVVGISCVAQVAQPPVRPEADSPSGDPPGRVGRLSLLTGTVSFRAAGDTAWAAAIPNRPVSTGDALWSDNESRAEVEVGSAELRIGSHTEIDVERLDDESIQASVPQGSTIVRLRTLAAGETDEIDAPNAAVGLGTAGEYRIDVSPDGATTTVTVFSGAAEVTADGASFVVEANQAATVEGGGGSSATYNLATVGAPDAFDQWSQARDAQQAEAVASAANYVSPYMPGAADLESNGQWEQDPTDGPIWYPRAVEAGWAPYRYGHWVWVGRWGWTWMDDASWGWAPFHYGRWAYVRGRWGWCPGRVIAPPVYAPALVVFVGGDGWNASQFGGRGGVGWFPLAPREVYRPPYAASTVYVRRVNITNVTNVTNITNVTDITNVSYRNRSVTNAVTAVSQRTFENGSPVARGIVRVPPDQARTAPVLGRSPVVPTRVSLVGEPATGRRAALPPAELQRRQVVAVHAPPPAPVPFSVQQRTLATTAGAPLTVAQVVQLRRQLPVATTTAVRVRPATTAMPGGAPLRPARPGLPAARPVTAAQPVRPPTTAQGSPPPVPARRPVTTVTPEPTASSPTPTRTPIPARPPAPAAQPPTRAMRLPPGAPPMTGATPTTARAKLDDAYVQQSEQMETRHAQEFANPPAGETQQGLAEQQDADHRDLEARYQQAAAAGKSTLSPPPTAAPRATTTKTARRAPTTKAAKPAAHPVQRPQAPEQRRP